MIKIARRFLSIASSQTRDIQVLKNGYHIQYVIPIRDDVISELDSFKIVNGEILVTFRKGSSTDIKEKIDDKFHYTH